MAYLGNPGSTLMILDKYHFTFQKKFGQNFLIDDHILTKIVDAAEIKPDDLVLEIGPGIGTMTQYLAERAREVVAVEIDKALIPVLNDTLSGYPNVTIINEDILKLDIQKLVNERNGGEPVKVVANLPYYITTPIIMGLFESHVPLKSITIMIQKEVAQRMKVGPGSKDYGALSLAVSYYSRVNEVAIVSPSCFIPKPNVESAVVRLDVYDKPPVETKDPEAMFKIIRASFRQRRKTLVNSLSNAGIGLKKEQILSALVQMEKPEMIRGETFTLEEFAKLSDLLLPF